MFNQLEVNAYGEKLSMGEVCQTIVQGTNSLLIKVFDDSVKEEVLKSLQRSEYDLSVSTEGKDIKVKLGTTKKEHIEAGLKHLKKLEEESKI